MAVLGGPSLGWGIAEGMIALGTGVAVLETKRRGRKVRQAAKQRARSTRVSARDEVAALVERYDQREPEIRRDMENAMNAYSRIAERLQSLTDALRERLGLDEDVDLSKEAERICKDAGVLIESRPVVVTRAQHSGQGRGLGFEL